MPGVFTSAIPVMAAQVVALVFLLAGVAKLLSKRPVSQSVEAYGVLSRPVARLIGILLPWIELAIAAALLTGIMGGLAWVLALTLLLIFSLAQATILLRGHEVPCGCFGSFSTRPVRWGNVLSNLALAACCLVAAQAFTGFFGFQWLGYSLPSETTPFPLATGVIVLQQITAGLFIDFMIFKQILENRGHEQAYLQYLRDLSAAAAIQRIGARSLPR